MQHTNNDTIRPRRHDVNPLYERVFLALGILSTSQQQEKRNMIRRYWMTQNAEMSVRSATLDDKVLTRFILCENATAAVVPEFQKEKQKYGDMLFVQAYDGVLYATKCFAWLRAALRVWRPKFIGLADDDAYVHVRLLTADLRLVAKELGSRASHLAFGAVEWFCYVRNTGNVVAWGGSPGGAASAYMREMKRWDGRLSLPFPFLKGPLMIYGRSLADTLANGNHSQTEQAKLLHVVVASKLPPRVIVDAFFGYVLASDRGFRGAKELVLINMQTDVAFRELRPSMNLSASKAGCHRVVHMGTNVARSIARRSSNSIAGVRKEIMAKLSQHRHTGTLKSLASLHCQPMQPYLLKASRGVHSALGTDWTSCTLSYKRFPLCGARNVHALKMGSRVTPATLNVVRQ
mmetsp:Transcript_46570/g.76967  ORF Transcript_46570/g.76967 Transcript_46570/m.76967 type:complete len:404 (-) Transcript_46570:169-1380(-)